MSKVSVYAFYGSLRRGMFNFEIYKKNLQFISTKTLSGFKLFALPNYPIAIKTGNLSDTIEVELFKVTDSKTESDIHKMEIDAGYYFDIIHIEKYKAGIYLFENSPGLPEVVGGNWVKYFQNKKHTK